MIHLENNLTHNITMRIKKVPELHAEKKYTVIEAALILGVSRGWFYFYIKKYNHILIPHKSENGSHQLFKGEHLLLLKELGVPNKRGRKKGKCLSPATN